MADISITAANVAASAQGTPRREYPFAQTTTAGQFVYLDANNKWALFDANVGAGAGAGITTLRGIALNGGAVNQPASVVTADPDFTPGGTLAPGVTYYGSVTAGGIAPDVPGAGSYTVVLGIGISATKMNLQPFSAGVAV